MKKKEETRERKPKEHGPIKATINEVLGDIGDSEYKDEKTLKVKKK